MNERARIAMLAKVLTARADGLRVGIGDDAAVLTPTCRPGAQIVWTVDEQVEGSHFRRAWVSFRDIGWRSFMAAASDLAAMGAEPWAALSALALPDDVGDDALTDIAQGQAEAARAVGAPIVGGNLTRSTALAITTTLLGTCASAVLRAGARAGDGVWLAGEVGLAAAGLRGLERKMDADPRLAPALAAFRRPRALISEGRVMASCATAATDVSDGLAADAGDIATASQVRLVLDAEVLASNPALLSAAEALGVPALDLALFGGEDYALVVTSSSPLSGYRQVGEVEAGEGLALRTSHGIRPLEARGYDAFRRD